ncbi:hypothetical protein AWC38_SpisGene19623 [Stylophora pistillata]|uniref:Uncharacterized protein n=1 Tax=Stylophora pistillata TaxID=50429 RepID=A0A2B4RI12_STYPI|nr:hypothetical protein AWC38_SpisGene19623 [Stylophora pistillata]
MIQDQKKRFKDGLKSNHNQCAIDTKEWENLAMNRTIWRKAIRDGVEKFEERLMVSKETVWGCVGGSNEIIWIGYINKVEMAFSALSDSVQISNATVCLSPFSVFSIPLYTVAKAPRLRNSDCPSKSNALPLIPAARPSSNPKTARRPLISEASAWSWGWNHQKRGTPVAKLAGESNPTSGKFTHSLGLLDTGLDDQNPCAVHQLRRSSKRDYTKDTRTSGKYISEGDPAQEAKRRKRTWGPQCSILVKETQHKGPKRRLTQQEGKEAYTHSLELKKRGGVEEDDQREKTSQLFTTEASVLRACHSRGEKRRCLSDLKRLKRIGRWNFKRTLMETITATAPRRALWKQKSLRDYQIHNLECSGVMFSENRKRYLDLVNMSATGVQTCGQDEPKTRESLDVEWEPRKPRQASKRDS